MTKIAFVGTGFVADYYMTTLANYPKLELLGVWDRDSARLKQFCAFHNVHGYESMDALLANDTVELVVNLTTPESHFPINKAALEAGKHVYCEKPLAMRIEDAETVIALAEDKHLSVCAAPANGLSDAHAEFARLLASGRIGRPRLAYAEMEDGPVFRADWYNWKSKSGAPWPGAHEFEIGCTLEHAGYALSWLVALFGPAAHLSAFSALTFPDKGPHTENLTLAPDFSVGCITFESGVVARLTSGLAAPNDRSLTVLGDDGTLLVRDLWDNNSPIHAGAHGRNRPLAKKVLGRLEYELGRSLPFRVPDGRRVRYGKHQARLALPHYPSKIDFARGVARQAEAMQGESSAFFSGRVALHLTELALALSSGESDYTPRNRFDFTPPWAG